MTERDEIKKALRKDLKDLGYNNKMVSVRNQVGANCWGLYVKIKDSSVKESIVTEIVEKYEIDPQTTVCGDPYLGTGFLILVESVRGNII